MDGGAWPPAGYSPEFFVLTPLLQHGSKGSREDDGPGTIRRWWSL
jgi:hypothetical protein